MSESTERPMAVWVKRNDALHTMECSNCGADAHYQIVDGVWRYEPFCAHCGARVFKKEDLPMSEEKKPRLAEILNVEVGEKFKIKGYFDGGFPFDEIIVFQLLEDGTYTTTPAMFQGSAVALLQSINHPERIIHMSRWTEQEVEDAKNIIRMFGEDRYPYVIKTMDGLPYLSDDLESLAMYTINLEPEIFPSLKPGRTVKLTDIIGGNT